MLSLTALRAIVPDLVARHRSEEEKKSFPMEDWPHYATPEGEAQSFGEYVELKNDFNDRDVADGLDRLTLRLVERVRKLCADSGYVSGKVLFVRNAMNGFLPGIYVFFKGNELHAGFSGRVVKA